MKKKIISFLVSGRGSNFKAIAQEIIKKKINAELGILISDKREAMALELAKDFGMKSFFIDPSAYKSREDHEKEMIKNLNQNKTDLIVAAGYMKVLTPYFVNRYKNCILNIHPALLPSFPGVNAQQQALDKGVKITGCTTHFIDEGTDTGPIIMQAAVPVFETDNINTLSARILKEEHKIFPETIKLFCEDRLKITGNKVRIKK